MINTKAIKKNLYMMLDKLDVLNRIKPLLKQNGYMIRSEDHKIVPRLVGVSENTPWVYVQSIPTSRCEIYHKVFFNCMQHIHSHCRSCWKVVVRPKTLEQLFNLYELQKEMGVACKCGMELRDSVHGLYGGYFYTRSKMEGLERYKQVRALVDECMGKDVDILLKRYCTEFEIGPGSQGDSDKIPLDVTDEEKELEEYIETHLPQAGYSQPQAKHLVANVLRRWIEYAYKNGDETYKLFTNGKRLFPNYITYHNKE